MLEGEDDVIVAAAAVNENYDVESPPDAVGGAVVGDVVADQASIRRNRIPEDDPVGDREPVLPGPVDPRRAPRRGRGLHRRARRRQQARAPPRVLGRRRGAPRTTSPGRPCGRSARRASTRPRRRSKSSTPCSPSAARSRRPSTSTRSCRRSSTPPRRSSPTTGARSRSRKGASCGSGRSPARPRSTARTPTPAGRKSSSSGSISAGTDVAVTQTEDGEHHGRPARDRGEVPRLLPRDGAAVLLRRPPQGRRGQARRPRLREPRAARLRRGNARPALDPRQPGDRRRPQRAALPAGPAGRVPEAAARESAGSGRAPEATPPAWPSAIAVAALVLFVVPWPLRIAAPARVLPGRRAAVTSLVDGIVASVLRREGDRVRAGDVIATLKDETLRGRARRGPRRRYAIAESDVARAREAGDAGAVFDAASRRDEAAGADRARGRAARADAAHGAGRRRHRHAAHRGARRPAAAPRRRAVRRRRRQDA